MARVDDENFQRDRDRREVKREPMEKVTTGVVKKQKKSFGRKVMDTFLSEKIDEVGDYIRYYIIGPGVKTLIYDIITGAISMSFWGDARGIDRGRSDGRGSARRQYDKIYDQRNRRDDRTRGSRPAYEYDDIIFETRQDADRVLDRLYDVLERYGKVRVADLYEASGISPDGNYTVNYYGWYSLKGTEPYPTGEGWILDLPRCESLR